MEKLSAEQRALLTLLRRSLWGEQPNIPDAVDWARVDTMAKAQGVRAFVYDGARDLDLGIPQEILQKWKQKMIAGILRNERLLTVQDQLLGWLEAAHIPAVILKGSSVSRYYPQPDLRILGDIDVLVSPENMDSAKGIFESHGYILCETETSYHIGFTHPRYREVHIELHFDATNLPDSLGGSRMKAYTASFLDGIDRAQLGSHRFPVLSETNQALALLLHKLRHLFASGIGLRQLCDWAEYVARMDSAAFVRTTLPILERCGLAQFARVATGTCVRYLGLPDHDLAWCGDIRDDECRALICSIFREGSMGTANQDGMSMLLTASEHLGQGASPVRSLFLQLYKLVRNRYPIVSRCKILLPFFLVFMTVRYWIRSLFGLRPKKSVAKVVSSAKQQRTLHDILRPFDPEQ